MLNSEQKNRYNRNIAINQIGIDGQIKLLNSKILIAGCGGLGSSVISNLASVGIGTLGLIDNDTVEISNLNRQFVHPVKNIGINKVESAKSWINSYNPEINVNMYNLRLDKSNCEKIIAEYDLVIDCFDSYESKFLLNQACIRSNKILVHGGVTEFIGQVMTIIPDKSACLNCLFPDYENSSYIPKGIISPVVSVIGSIQSMEALKILLDFNELLDNCILSYDGIRQSFRKIKVNSNPNCPACNSLSKTRM